MADSKITALTSIGTSTDPSLDQMVIVDTSDGSMAATGTTKKVSLNQLLSSNPSATGGLTLSDALAAGSASITGDLTVDTNTLKVDSANNRVGVGIATPGYKLHVQGSAALQLVLQTNDTNANAKEGTVNVRHYTNAEEPVSAVGGFTTSTANEVYLGGGFSGGNAATLLGFYTAANNTTTIGTERYRIASDGVATWSNVGGVAGTAMTLNSTGLGVGTSPSATLDIRKNASGSRFLSYHTGGNGTVTAGADLNEMRCDDTTTAYNLLNINVLGTSRFLVTSTGNVGIGVTPSAWSGVTALQISRGSFAADTGSYTLSQNVYNNGGNKYIASAAALQFQAIPGTGFLWYTAPSGTAGNAITFTQAMTLDASGTLLVGDTSSQVVGVRASIMGSGGFAVQYTGSTGTFLHIVPNAANGTVDIKADARTGAYPDLTIQTSSTQRVRVKSTGQVRFVPLAADPAGAEAGDVYYNSTSNKLKCYNGTSWNDLF